MQRGFSLALYPLPPDDPLLFSPHLLKTVVEYSVPVFIVYPSWSWNLSKGLLAFASPQLEKCSLLG